MTQRKSAKLDDFWPVTLATVPPTIMTKEEAYKKVPNMKVTYIPATDPRPEHDSKAPFPVPDNHRKSNSYQGV